MDIDLESFGSKFVLYLIKNHEPVSADEITTMANMRLLDVLPILAVLTDRSIIEKTENGYVMNRD